MEMKYSVNPFGEKVDSKGNIVKEDNVIIKIAKSSTTRNVAIFMITMIVAIVSIIVIGNNSYFNSSRLAAEQSINDFNKSSMLVMESSKDEQSIESIKSVKDNAENEDQREIAEGILEIINSFKEEPLDLINVNMTGEEAAMASFRQITICDIITNIPVEGTALFETCSEFNKVGKNMLINVSSFNSMIDKWYGKMAFTGNKNPLPDMQDPHSSSESE